MPKYGSVFTRKKVAEGEGTVLKDDFARHLPPSLSIVWYYLSVELWAKSVRLENREAVGKRSNLQK